MQLIQQTKKAEQDYASKAEAEPPASSEADDDDGGSGVVCLFVFGCACVCLLYFWQFVVFLASTSRTVVCVFTVCFWLRMCVCVCLLCIFRQKIPIFDNDDGSAVVCVLLFILVERLFV